MLGGPLRAQGGHDSNSAVNTIVVIGPWEGGGMRKTPAVPAASG